MRGELTLARCLHPPISPIKNILPSRSARSSPGPQLYFINTFRQVQKGMIHAGPERSETQRRGAFARGRRPERDQAWPSGGIISLLQGSRLPVRSWKDLPTRPPFGTPASACAQTQPPRAPGRGCRPSPSPGGRRPPLPPRPSLPLPLPSALLGDSARQQASRPACPPWSSVPSSPGGWAPRVLHASPTMPSSVPCTQRDTGRCQVTTVARLLSGAHGRGARHRA